MTLEGKTVLITGVSSGIGKAMATLFLDSGACVYGTSRSSKDLPTGLHHIPADLTVESDVESLFCQLPGLDLLINNAGVAHLSRISDGDPGLWEKMWELNVHATALCCQKGLPLMREGGVIINVSSLSGHRVPPTGGFYSPTKFAVSALTTALRNELADDPRRLRVSTLSPGFVDTPILDIYFKGREADLAKTKETTRMLDPRDVAEAALYIATAPPHVAIDDVKVRSVEQAG